MKFTPKQRGLSLLEVLVGAALAGLLTTVLLALWMSVGRYALLTEQRINIRDLATQIFARIEVDTQQSTLAAIDITTNGGDTRMSLQKFTGAAEDGAINWTPEAEIYNFSATEKRLTNWESVVRTDSPPLKRPKTLTPEEILAFQPEAGKALRTWPAIEKATFHCSSGRPVLTVTLALAFKGMREREHRFETQQSFALLNGYEP